MSKTQLRYKLVVMQADKLVEESVLSYDSIASLVSSMQDDPSSEEIYEVFSRHPASIVRENVAYKDNLNLATVTSLASDHSINVLRNLTRSQAFRQHATEDMLRKMIPIDTEVAQSIAGYIDSFENCNISKIVEFLLEIEDPSIPTALANNYNSPKNLLKMLTKHPDPYISSQAKRNI